MAKNYNNMCRVMANFTLEHSLRTSEIVRELLPYLKDAYPQLALESAQKAYCTAALLHDLGKSELTPALLVYKGNSDNLERMIREKHTLLGVKALPGIWNKKLGGKDTYLICRQAILCHHERYNGSGYPIGLLGNRIPLVAQVTGIADTYDAMTTRTANGHRHKALTKKKALKLIENNAGKLFSKELTEIFIRCMKK